ncbi:MAG: hypothetical protein U0176_24785 [Bacteroidia bacterium]
MNRSLHHSLLRPSATILGWLAILGALIGCQSPKSKFDAKARERVVSESREALYDYHANICKEGLLAEFAYLDSSADFHWRPPGTEVELGYDSVSKAIRLNANAIDSTCGHWVSLEVEAVAWDTARYSGILEIWTRMANAETSMVRLLEEGLMVKRKEGWKLQSGRTELAPD